jgi:hypothetical protein
MRRRPIYKVVEGWQIRQRFGSRIYHTIANRRICGPRRDQSPKHEPALIAALLPDNHGNVGGKSRGRR